MKVAVVVVIGCVPNTAKKRIPVFSKDDLEIAFEELQGFEPLSYEDFDKKLLLSDISVFGHGDWIDELVSKLIGK